VLEHERRRVVHFNVTDAPSAHGSASTTSSFSQSSTCGASCGSTSSTITAPGPTSHSTRTPPSSASAIPPMRETSSPSRWSVACIIATRDAQPDPKSRSHTKSAVSVSCAHCARPRRMPRSIRARRTVGNARGGPSSVRWVTFAIIAAHVSRRTRF
jgi:hypothetical protein